MLFLLCMTNHLQAGRNLLGRKNSTGNARSPATPWSSRAALSSSGPCSQRDAEMRLWGLCSSPWTLMGAAGCGVLQGGWAGCWHGDRQAEQGMAARGKLCGVPQHPAALSQLLQGKQWGADGETPHKGQPFTPSPQAAHSPRYFQVPGAYWLPGTNLHIA